MENINMEFFCFANEAAKRLWHLEYALFGDVPRPENEYALSADGSNLLALEIEYMVSIHLAEIVGMKKGEYEYEDMIPITGAILNAETDAEVREIVEKYILENKK